MGLFQKIVGSSKPGSAARPAPPPAATVPQNSRPPEPREISAEELQRLMASDSPPLLIDVRESPELARDGRIPGAVHMPMSSFQGREAELDPSCPMVIHCASGMRSYDVGCYLLDKGFESVANLTGGIHAWPGERARA